ncbi:MAG TPA: TlpA disulfide reductase family protein [Chthoniobacterales bacterium]
MRRRSPFFTRAALVAAIAAACFSIASLQAAGARTAAAPWQLNDVNGKALKLSDFKGKVVILDFWATWCPPCRAEIPGFVALQKKYAGSGLTVIGVSLDEQGPSVVKPFMQRLAMNYPVVMGDEKISADYGGISAIPTTFVIDREGNVVTSHQGFTDQATFEAEISPLLGAGKG